jgi:hypothetical protein
MNEITTQPQPTDVVTVDNDFLAKLAMDQNVTAEKLQVMADVSIKLREYNRQCQREDDARMARLIALDAKSKMQGELPVFEKDIPNPHTKSKFTDFADIWEQCCPIWTKHGFNISFDVVPTMVPENIKLKSILTHSSGYVEEYFTPETPPDDRGPQGTINKTMPQGQQASITYLQRGLLCRTVGIVMKREDDDGNSGARGHDRGPVGQGPEKPQEYSSQWLTDARKTVNAIRTVNDEWKRCVYKLIDAAPVKADLDGLIDHVRNAVNSHPEMHDQIQSHIGEAHKRLKKASQAAPHASFEYIIYQVDGEPLDGVVYNTPAAWSGEFLGYFDSLDKADQQAVLERNATAIADASRMDHNIAERLKRAHEIAHEEKRPETPAATPPRERGGMFDPDPDREWADARLAELDKCVAGDGVVILAKSMKERMDAIKKGNPPLWTEVNSRFNAKHAALTQPAP